MARALAIHLPAELDEVAAVLGVSERKDKAGRALMLKMAKPRKVETIEADDCPTCRGSSFSSPGSGYGDVCGECGGLRKIGPPTEKIIWWDDPELIERLGAYCDQDVLTEEAIDERLPPLSDDERRIWELDQRINDRGMALDVESIHRCVAVLEVAQERANARMAELTQGYVRKVTEATRIVEWLQQRGIPADSIAKAEHSTLLAWADMLEDETVREVLLLRAESAKSSTAKFRAMLNVVCDDGRARGLLQYHRAGTGRWGGTLLQPHNLPRVDEEKELPLVLGALETMQNV